jgi:hypothetical protein
MEKSKQQVRDSATDRVSTKTVYNVQPSQDSNVPTMSTGYVKHGRKEVKVYWSDLTERWCNA